MMPEVARETATGRQRLSVVILAKNEEARIRRCLESVAWADEILVVDGLSEDRTVELCRSAGATVISHAFEGSFAVERNLGMARATGDWVLQLDADDVVTPQLRAAVERILESPQPHVAFKFRRKSYLLGRFMRHGGWYHELPNLVRRDVRYEGLVHERPRLSGTVGRIAADVEHHPCSDLEGFLARHNRYTSLSAQELLATQGRLDEAALKDRLLRKPLKAFWKTYVKKQGFREGLHGLVFSVFFAGVELMKWAKYWELWAGIDTSARVPPLPAPGEARPVRGGRRATLSVVLMTKNEEPRLAACLDRVAGWADEIVVIDDCSTDRTVEIARRYTDRVQVAASGNNHDRQWNRGIAASTREWILHIDADEAVTPGLRAAIDEALDRAGDTAAFELMRLNVFLGRAMRHGGWRHRHRILFRRAGARCTGQGIHVQLQVDGRVVPLDAEIEHYPFTSLAQFLERQNLYTTVEARVRHAAGPRPTARTIYYQLTVRPIKLFWKSYAKQEGRREGWHGLVFALLYAFTHAMYWAKVWSFSLTEPIAWPADPTE